MPEQLLHHPHVGTAVEQMRGVRVPQGVRGDGLRPVDRQTGPLRRPPQDGPGTLPGQRATAGVEEDRRVPRPAAASPGLARTR
ncbi:hypothetical protein Jiend_04830 [Micromonospora endophytica]|nr:hypothetical protein Jiend_04830 [Micromonospora endophytica]